MTLDRVSLTEINKKAEESAEKDQTARMCWLILLHNLLKKWIYSHERQNEGLKIKKREKSKMLSFSTELSPSKLLNYLQELSHDLSGEKLRMLQAQQFRQLHLNFPI